MEIVARYLARAIAVVNWIGQFALTLVSYILTPILMFLVLPFVRQNSDNVLPKSLQLFNTYDDLGQNQGLYESQVYAWFILPTTFGQWLLGVLPSWFPRPSTPSISLLQTVGFYLKTWYWLGIRNQCYTLFYWIAPTVGQVSKRETSNWKILTSGSYWCILNKNVDVGFGWKLFNGPGKCSFYFRPRFWKAPSN